MPEITYAEAGVDIRKEDMVVKAISNRLRSTFKTREGRIGEVMRDIGGFANLIDLKNDHALAMCTDGVGSKVLVAQALGDYTTIGEDLVAMNVNDLICIGAEPLAMVDYLAAEKKPFQINVHNVVPLLLREIFHRSSGDDTGTVDQNINPVEIIDDSGD